ncbi:hypothetical protein [Streptomyces sp. NBC_01089]|uniref:hypothetical protein n=1 Tax=Streptomyces sp. NBC_01089 TaxID=2903747 RepID=UPI003868EC36|nr:hypothetical protein OG510_16675 [Streptomyces sp. NBC_01089]
MADTPRPAEVNPAATEVTRFLCQAVYARPDRLKQLNVWWRKFRGKGATPRKPRRSTRRPIYLQGGDDCPPLGEPTAQWIVDHVLNGPPTPVPSYGFDLVPVVAHSLRARRGRRLRRLCFLLVLAAAGYISPWATAIWVGAGVVALTARWAAFRAQRKQKFNSRLARRPRLAYLPLFIPWMLALVSYVPGADVVSTARIGLAVVPFGLLAGMAVVYAGDRLVARAALSVLSRSQVSCDALPWAMPKATRRMSVIGEKQEERQLPYDASQHFIGAGRDHWGAAHINILLKLKDPEEPVKSLGDSELLRRVGTALDELGRGVKEITDPLPGFSMERVLGLPSHLWLQRTREVNGEAPDLTGRGRRSPSSEPTRLYLRAQCITWDGQVVVSVFVHAALEAGELRLTVRPHVMTPLHNELKVTAASAEKRGVRLLRWVTAQAVLDATVGPLALWQLVARMGLGESLEGRAEEDDPVSLRDRYSTEEVTDMHQSDDAKRHVVLMETCVFRTVATYLRDLGIDTTAYDQQVAAVTNNIQIYGDNNAPIQSVVGNGNSNIGQGSTSQGGK